MLACENHTVCDDLRRCDQNDDHAKNVRSDSFLLRRAPCRLPAKSVHKTKAAVVFDRRFETFVAGVGDTGQPRSATAATSYEDLYLTEQPYGLVFGVETVLPANDWSNAALT
jgi:hypothetical protein